MLQVDLRGSPSGEDLEKIVDAARAALDQEFERAERFDSKARGQMTLAGSWFAVVQAVAAVALGQHAETGWVIGIAAGAALAGIALSVAMIKSAAVWKLRPQPAVSHETLEDMLAAAEREPERFGRKLVQLYRHLLGNAQTVNEKRATALDHATQAWWPALILGFVELLVALLSRILGA